jgi:GTP cyclohydrolase I
MKDVQSQPDDRGIPLDQVGVKGLRYPIVVLDKAHQRQQTVADITMSVSLPHHFKGTHMSRFLEVLNEHHGEVTMRTLPAILKRMREHLDAESARIELNFPYFLEREAPVSKAKGLMDYECHFMGEMKGEVFDFTIGVKVPVTSLCPCSKEISDYGAHNQRGIITIEVKSTLDDQGHPHLIWFEELIEVAEASGSSPVYPLLKREDERFVTMKAYENPVFVEDIVRNVVGALNANKSVAWCQIHVENFESIHNHSAYAITHSIQGDIQL